MIWSMLSNAFLVSFLFAVISKSETRSIQIVYSKKLCVNVVDGKVCINVRCYDLVRFACACVLRMEYACQCYLLCTSTVFLLHDIDNFPHEIGTNNRSIHCLFSACYQKHNTPQDSSHPLVECHARMYLIDQNMKFHPLRLLEPNDDLGGCLYPSVPTPIIHHIDHHSGK